MKCSVNEKPLVSTGPTPSSGAQPNPMRRSLRMRPARYLASSPILPWLFDKMDRGSVKRKGMDDSSPGDANPPIRTGSLAVGETNATRPMGPPQQVRVLSLCLNRVLQEPGLTRMIQGYYKGILETEVWDRIQVVSVDLSASEVVNERVIAMYQEYATYAQYYSNHVVFMKQLMKFYARHVPEDHERVFLPVFRCFLASTRSHTQELIKPFSELVYQLLNRTIRSGWVIGRFTNRSSIFIEGLEKSGAIHFLHQVENDIDSYLDPNDNTSGNLLMLEVTCIMREIFDYMVRMGRDDPLVDMISARTGSLRSLLHMDPAEFERELR